MRQLAVLVTAAVLALFAAVASAKSDQPSEVRDLHYGVVLYYLYQDDFLNTITQLQMAQQLDRLDFHANEARLMEGGLLLSYGMHREAQRIYQNLLQGEDVSRDMRNRIWLELARIAYQRGFYDDTLNALNNMNGKVSIEVAGNRRMLQAQALMARDEFAAAEELLKGWTKPRSLKPYADFNHGVALIRNGRNDAGFAVLESVSEMKATGREMLTLKDRANLDLGLALVRAGDPQRAMTFLARVRLSGSMASRALLGAGWASAVAEDYQQALVYWEELSGRDTSEHAVQEALLAVPYAYTRLGGLGTAADRYESALDILRAEETRLANAIAGIKSGTLFQALADLERNRLLGGRWHLDTLPPMDETRYIIGLLATHTFREALRNYFDLQVLEDTLEHWSDSMVAFDDILATRREGYESRVPQVENALAEIDLFALRQLQADYEQRYSDIKAATDEMALANDRELAWLDRFQSMNSTLSLLPNVPKYNDIRDKHAFLHGHLLWQVVTDYKPRLRAVRKQLSEMDEAILVAELRRESVGQAMTAANSRFEGYGDRIVGYAGQVERALARTRRILAAQSEFLQNLAVAELKTQHEALRQYIVRGQFALAQIYDQAAPAETTQPEQ